MSGVDPCPVSLDLTWMIVGKHRSPRKSTNQSRQTLLTSEPCRYLVAVHETQPPKTTTKLSSCGYESSNSSRNPKPGVLHTGPRVLGATVKNYTRSTAFKKFEQKLQAFNLVMLHGRIPALQTAVQEEQLEAGGVQKVCDQIVQSAVGLKLRTKIRRKAGLQGGHNDGGCFARPYITAKPVTMVQSWRIFVICWGWRRSRRRSRALRRARRG